jgi:hypothetical protein
MVTRGESEASIRDGADSAYSTADGQQLLDSMTGYGHRGIMGVKRSVVDDLTAT